MNPVNESGFQDLYVKPIAESLLMAKARNETNAQQLNTLATAHYLVIDSWSHMAVPFTNIFKCTASVLLFGQSLQFEGCGYSKKESKEYAARSAIEHITHVVTPAIESCQCTNPVCSTKYSLLKNKYKELERKYNELKSVSLNQPQ